MSAHEKAWADYQLWFFDRLPKDVRDAIKSAEHKVDVGRMCKETKTPPEMLNFISAALCREAPAVEILPSPSPLDAVPQRQAVRTRRALLHRQRPLWL